MTDNKCESRGECLGLEKGAAHCTVVLYDKGSTNHSPSYTFFYENKLISILIFVVLAVTCSGNEKQF